MESVAQPPVGSAEIVERFRSCAEWRAWSDAHGEIYAAGQAEKIIAEIRANGVLDPLTRRPFPPEQVLIRHDNYRETIKAGLLISRHRALLFELRHVAAQGRGHLVSRQCKIYAPEALTDFALYLRGNFFRFVGSEYAETAEEKQALYPIQAEDLTKLSLPSDAFDLVISNDVFEHVPDLDCCLREVSRVLGPQGVLISTFPFVFSQEAGMVKARLKDGQIEYLTEPEYHGNPMKPAGGSLVFELPGWDFVARARAAGFEDAYFAFISSARHGILGKGINGVFVFVALKRLPAIEKPDPPIPVAPAAKPRFDIVAGLIGLPRSGTTVLAAAVGAHPGVKVLYEPWNARKTNMPPTNMGVAEFVTHIGVECTDEQRVLFVKETATDPAYLNAIDALLADAAKGGQARLIWLYRDPLHAFLSELQARRDWWGEPDISATVDTFDKWAQRSLQALKKIVEMCEKHPAMCVYYGTFVSAPSETLRAVMAYLGLSFDEAQLDYFKSLDRSEIRGDINVSRNPQAISGASSEKRSVEAESIRDTVAESKYFGQIDALRNAGKVTSGAMLDIPGRSNAFLSWARSIISA